MDWSFRVDVFVYNWIQHLFSHDQKSYTVYFHIPTIEPPFSCVMVRCCCSRVRIGCMSRVMCSGSMKAGYKRMDTRSPTLPSRLSGIRLGKEKHCITLLDDLELEDSYIRFLN